MPTQNIHPKLPPGHQPGFTGLVIGFLRENAWIAYFVKMGRLKLKYFVRTIGKAKKSVPIMHMILQKIALHGLWVNDPPLVGCVFMFSGLHPYLIFRRH